MRSPFLGRALLVGAALPLLAGAAGHNDAPAAPAEPTGSAAAAPVSAPAYAARLAEAGLAAGPAGWGRSDLVAAWHALPAARADRQPARWALARAFVAAGHGAEALGVLDVMAADEPDLALVGSYRLARGAALVMAGRAAEAVASLDMPALALNAEACAWRLRALVAEEAFAPASGAAMCAAPAVAARTGPARAPFLRAAAAAELVGGRYDQAAQTLHGLSERDPAANLLRARLAAARGQAGEARIWLGRAALKGGAGIAAAARLGRIELDVGRGALPPAKALAALRPILFTARGGATERRALTLALRLATASKDEDAVLAYGATKLRYHPLIGKAGAGEAGALRDRLLAILAAGLTPDSTTPLPRAADRLWRYRDLVPSGAAGDGLLLALAARLEAAELYARAAELVEFHMERAAMDIERGPLSIRVARNWLKAGQPARAVAALRATATIAYPEAMTATRRRLEAIALHHLGKAAPARALLAGSGDDGLIPDMAWHAGDWAGYLASAGAASDPDTVLKRAIALVMLGRDDELAALRRRHRAALGGAVAPLFEALTGDPAAVEPEALMRAVDAVNAAPLTGDAALLTVAPAKS